MDELTYSEDARLSGKEYLTEKAKYLLKKTHPNLPRDERPSPILQEAIVSHDLLGGKIAALITTKDHITKLRSVYKVETALKGSLTKTDPYNKITKAILTGDILEKK